MESRLHVYVQGHVQGVGYRYSTAVKARGLGLAGWVRNLRDGRVEAEFEGPQERLEQMLAWCRRGPSGAVVREVEVEWHEEATGLKNFEIRH